MDAYGKTADIVDLGGETDYSGHEWFQDPPIRPQPVRMTSPSRDLVTDMITS